MPKLDSCCLPRGCVVPFTQRLSGAACLAVGFGHNGLEKSKEEAYHMDLSATVELKAQVWYRWTVRAWQLMEALRWRLGNCEYCSPDLVPIVSKP